MWLSTHSAYCSLVNLCRYKFSTQWLKFCTYLNTPRFLFQIKSFWKQAVNLTPFRASFPASVSTYWGIVRWRRTETPKSHIKWDPIVTKLSSSDRMGGEGHAPKFAYTVYRVESQQILDIFTFSVKQRRKKKYLLPSFTSYRNSAISKTRAVPSSETETRKSVLAETDSDWMVSEWPLKALTQSPERLSHTRTLPSTQPVAKNLDAPSHIKQVTPS